MTDAKKRSRIKALLVAALSGGFVFQAGNCTTQQVKTQFSKGLSTAINGVFNIGVTDLSNQVFDVDD